MKAQFSVSLMCMDLLKLKEQLEILNERADMLHVDIMDGHYVKNITLSPMFVEAISKVTKIPIDVHLMTEYPSDYIEELAKAGATYICPHAETINKDAFRIINMIKNAGAKVGIVINPATPLDYIKHYIHLIDKLTIMTVDPGFAGQPFIPEMLEKIKEAKRYKEEKGLNFLLEIDGSANQRTFKRLHEAGAEVFIVGSSGLFSLDEDLNIAYDKMEEIFKKETM
ncbi:MAG: D-allulose 6-phosphate 3-epimerase [Lautropia sp.]|nr:D-allulose 6-phosphate 3-epimerase [Lautropia sp.]